MPRVSPEETQRRVQLALDYIRSDYATPAAFLEARGERMTGVHFIKWIRNNYDHFTLDKQQEIDSAFKSKLSVTRAQARAGSSSGISRNAYMWAPSGPSAPHGHGHYQPGPSAPHNQYSPGPSAPHNQYSPGPSAPHGHGHYQPGPEVIDHSRPRPAFERIFETLRPEAQLNLAMNPPGSATAYAARMGVLGGFDVPAGQGHEPSSQSQHFYPTPGPGALPARRS